MEKAGDLIKKFFSENNFDGKKSNFDIFKSWEFIIGKKIFGHSRIIDISNHILFIEVDHPGWLQIVVMKEKEILKKIKDKYPELEIYNLKYQIKYRSIKTDNNKKKSENVNMDSEYKPLPKIEDVKYTELKNSLNKLYKSVLNNQRRVDKNKELE